MHDIEVIAAMKAWLPAGDGPLRAHLSLALRQAIQSGQLPKGTRLPPERALATALHVSRPTISAVIDDLRGAGFITSRQGSGSWISGAHAVSGPVIPFAERVQAAGGIDLASAVAPDATFIPSGRVETGDLLGVDPMSGFTPVGLWALRSAVAERANHYSPTTPESVMITSGAHQALALAIAALAPRGSTVLLEDTTYGGLVDMVHANGCHPLPIERDADGPIPDRLRELLDAHRPSVVVLVSSVHSPTGFVSPDGRCTEIAEVLTDTDVHVILDETFSDLEFEPGTRLLSRLLGPRAVRTGSLSKSLWTGLRTGWLIAEPPTLATIARRRWRQFDLGPSVPSQLFALQAFDDFDAVIGRRRAHVIERSEWMHEWIGRRLPQWNLQQTNGGLTVWVQIPEDGESFAQRADQQGVAVLPGAACRTDQQPTNHIRLCVDRPLDVLQEAMERLEAMGPVPMNC